jgi:streptogramin lyase
VGPDGNLWFTEPEGEHIGRITAAGAVTEFDAENGTGFSEGGITVGPDGNLWFTDFRSNRVKRITPTGSVTEFSSNPASQIHPSAITAGPDGNLWFTELWAANAVGNSNMIGRLSPRDGRTAHFGQFFTDGTKNPAPADITAGPDGNLWFTLPSLEGAAPSVGADQIGRITPAGSITLFPVALGSGPTDITAGPDGNLWFTEAYADQIGRITPSGVVTEFSARRVDLHESAAGVSSITAGPDGNLWFAEVVRGSGYTRIGRITPTGEMSKYLAVCTDNGYVSDLAWGPDGKLWLSAPGLNTIFRIDDLADGCLPAKVRSKGVGFRFRRLIKNRMNGTATLVITTVTGGRLLLYGRGVSRKRRTLKSAGTLRLKIESTGKKRRKLHRTGEVKVRVKVRLITSSGRVFSRKKLVELSVRRAG